MDMSGRRQTAVFVGRSEWPGCVRVFGWRNGEGAALFSAGQGRRRRRVGLFTRPARGSKRPGFYNLR